MSCYKIFRLFERKLQCFFMTLTSTGKNDTDSKNDVSYSLFQNSFPTDDFKHRIAVYFDHL